MKKRCFSLLLAIFLCVCAMPTAAAASAEISVTPSVQTVKEGDTFTVTAAISGNSGFSAVQFTLMFDESKVECVSASTGALLKGMLAATNPSAEDGAIVAAASTSEVTGDGVLATFTFRALSEVGSAFQLADIILSDSDGGAVPCFSIGGKVGTGSGTVVKPSDPVDPKPEPETKPDPKPETKPETKPEQSKPTEKPAEVQKPTEQPKPEEKPAETPSTAEKPEKPEETHSTAEKPAQPEQTVEHRFTDTKGHWAESYINSAVEKGLFGGYADGSFRPGNAVTRGAFVTVLWRMAGKPQPTGDTPFTDIGKVSEEFRSAITWAYNQGYISGRTATAFAPGDSISRQAAMKILYGFSGGAGEVDPMFMMAFNLQYPDAAKLPSWASAPMYWGVQNGIISGTTDGRLNGGGTATRAQLAKILSIYDEKFNG